MTSSVPLIIKIQTQPILPITISPKPLSAYSLAPGEKLMLFFEVSDPQNLEIIIAVNAGAAKAFATTEIELSS